jgi:hypothetical protein
VQIARERIASIRRAAKKGSSRHRDRRRKEFPEIKFPTVKGFSGTQGHKERAKVVIPGVSAPLIPRCPSCPASLLRRERPLPLGRRHTKNPRAIGLLAASRRDPSVWTTVTEILYSPSCLEGGIVGNHLRKIVHMTQARKQPFAYG